MWYPKVEVLLERHRPKEAEAAVREELARNPDDPLLHMYLAAALLDQGKRKAGEAAARSCIARDPEFDGGYFLLSRALEEQSKHKEALEVVEEGIALRPEEADFWARKAALLFHLNRHEKALEAAETGLAMEPDNENCRFYRSILLGQRGRYEEADEEALALLEDSPDDAENHCARGWVMYSQGNGEAAEQHFVAALRITPGHEDARLGLVEALKLRSPVMGGAMRLLIRIGRLPWTYLLGAVIALNVIGRVSADHDSAVISLGGDLLRLGLLLFFLMALVSTPLFNLGLASSKRGRLALSEDEKRILWWAAVPLAIGGYFVLRWTLRMGSGIPAEGVAWCAVAALVAEVVESPRRAVRVRMAVVAGAAALVATALVLASRFYVAPQVVEAVLGLVRATAEARDGGDEAVRLGALEDLKETLSLRQQLVVYPALAFWFLAAFRDDLRAYFERRVADED